MQLFTNDTLSHDTRGSPKHIPRLAIEMDSPIHPTGSMEADRDATAVQRRK